MNEEQQNNQRSFLHLAVVVGTNPGTYTVQVESFGQNDVVIKQAVPLSSVFSHLLGFKESSLPPIGSTVFCYSANKGICYILGIVPPEDQSGMANAFPFRAVLGAGDGNNDSFTTAGYNEESSKQYTFNRNRPTDVSEGEYTLSNDFGILFGLFQQFAVLKASELAQVQVHVLDDLVRVISHNFQHFTCLGEHKIFHDGNGLHVEFGLTHDPSEALGIPTNGEKTFEDTGVNKKDDSENFVKSKDEQVVGIERLKGFVGALSDFVQLMLVRPADDAVRSVNGDEPEVPDRGLFNVHLASDGSFFMRSLSGIYLEKTNWIRVPHRIRTPEDPEGDDAADSEFNYEPKDAFQFDKSHPYSYFLQIRDYLAYLQEDLAYKNFKTHEKDFYVNDDVADETPIDGINAVHKGMTSTYEPRVSGFYMMPNGGFMMKDAWGSSIVMEGGNIYLQPAKDLVSQPLRNFVAKVGGFTSIAGRKDIDLSSTDGAFRLKTDGSQHLYSESSGIIIQTNGAQSGEPYTPVDPADGGLQHVNGIVLHAPNTGVYAFAKEHFIRATDNALVRADRIIQDADKLVLTTCLQDIVLNSQKNTVISSDSSVSITSERSAIFFGATTTAVGRKDQTFAIANPLSGQVEGFFDNDQVADYLLKLDEFDELHVVDMARNFRSEDDTEFTDLKFRFPSSNVYGLSESVDAIPQTIAQQEDSAFANQQLTLWEESAVNDTYPYPGADNAMFFLTAGLDNLENKAGEIFNKPVGSSESNLDELQDIFKAYRVK